MGNPKFYLEAGEYSDLALVCPVVNKASFGYHTLVHVPMYPDDSSTLYQVDQINPATGELSMAGNFEKEFCKPWVKFLTSALDLRPGQHIYKMSFIDKVTQDTSHVFFNYILQDDCPDKPYVYMR